MFVFKKKEGWGLQVALSSFLRLDQIVIIHTTADGHLGYCNFLANMNNAGANIVLYVLTLGYS